jgi:hypothetical protein
MRNSDKARFPEARERPRVGTRGAEVKIVFPRPVRPSGHARTLQARVPTVGSAQNQLILRCFLRDCSANHECLRLDASTSFDQDENRVGVMPRRNSGAVVRPVGYARLLTSSAEYKHLSSVLLHPLRVNHQMGSRVRAHPLTIRLSISEARGTRPHPRVARWNVRPWCQVQ